MNVKTAEAVRDECRAAASRVDDLDASVAKLFSQLVNTDASFDGADLLTTTCREIISNADSNPFDKAAGYADAIADGRMGAGAMIDGLVVNEYLAALVSEDGSDLLWYAGKLARMDDIGAVDSAVSAFFEDARDAARALTTAALKVAGYIERL